MNIRWFTIGLSVLLLNGIAVEAQSVHGTITNAVTKRPVRGASITLLEISKTFSSDSAGNFASDTIPPGSYSIQIEAPQYLKLVKKIFIASPKEVGTSELEFNAMLYRIRPKTEDTASGSVPIQYQFPGHADVEITIRNDMGILIRKEFDRTRESRMRSFLWDGKNNDGEFVPPGKYNCKVTSARFIMIRSIEWKGQAK